MKLREFVCLQWNDRILDYKIDEGKKVKEMENSFRHFPNYDCYKKN